MFLTISRGRVHGCCCGSIRDLLAAANIYNPLLFMSMARARVADSVLAVFSHAMLFVPLPRPWPRPWVRPGSVGGRRDTGVAPLSEGHLIQFLLLHRIMLGCLGQLIAPVYFVLRRAMFFGHLPWAWPRPWMRLPAWRPHLYKRLPSLGIPAI